jgi:hypothetical protein
MSGNINDTNTREIKEQVYSMIHDLENNTLTAQECIEKYNSLYRTSKTLFDYISKQTFDKHDFHKNLELMLNQIELIQSRKLSQYTASSNVGYHLADKYLPK